MNFETVYTSLRYGLNERINLVATIPWFSIDSRKIQGAPYTRINKGIGDITLEAEYALTQSPQLMIAAGVKLPSGKVDNVDEFNQRICDILALGSGTTDFLLGGGLWVPHFGIEKLSMYASARHRFVSGHNKFGYEYGDQTTARLRAEYPWRDLGSFGVILEAFHSKVDTWYGNVVPERGSTFVYLSPTVNYKLTENIGVGAFVRFPMYMELEGSQMVASSTIGFDITTNITDFMNGLLESLGVTE